MSNVTHAVSYSLGYVRAFFDVPMLGLGTSANFTVAGCGVSSSTASADRTFVDLVLTGTTLGTTYTVVVGAGVTDDSSNALIDDSADFVAGFCPGGPIDSSIIEGIHSHPPTTWSGSTILSTAEEGETGGIGYRPGGSKLFGGLW